MVLDENHPSVIYLCHQDERLNQLIHKIGPIQYYLNDEPYAFLVHEIIEQMLSIKVGETIYNRLVDLCDGQIIPEKVNALSDEQIKSIGTSGPKVKYIRSLTDKIINRSLDLGKLEKLSDQDAMKELMKVKGIGQWTAKMYIMFVLDRQDVLPIEDLTFLQAYKWLYQTDDINKKAIETRCSCWSPYASIGARYLYEALDSGLTKTTTI